MRRVALLLLVGGALLLAPALVGCSKHSPTKPASAIPSYELVAAWGDSGTGNGQFWIPWGVTVDASGNVYVVEAGNNRIQKFTTAGTYVSQWGDTGSANGQFNAPHHVAVDSSGNVYVADTGNHRIQKFTRDGGFLTQWGSQGTGDGQFQYPIGLAVHAGNVYVTDSGNSRVQEFTSTGTYVSQWGTFGDANGQFHSPQGVAVDDSGDVYVVDGDFNFSAGGYHHRVEKFTATGTYLTGWGGYGHQNGQFYDPDGIAVDTAGNVYVADTENWRIQKFTRMGAYLTQWTLGPNAKGYAAAGGIAVDALGQVYVAEWNFYCRVQKYAPTPQ